ncbi:MAG: single-stranded DNA-binding protein [Phycisphaerales bacterium]|nr:single-stranded DNA-binding protein [Phycisphaerales bacterium]
MWNNLYNQGNGNAHVPQSPLAVAVSQGQFPYINRVELVGMVFPSEFLPKGWEWKDGHNHNGQQRPGHLKINLLVRHAWGGQTPGIVNAKFRIIAYGQLGQQIANMIGLGAMIRVVGNLKVSNFKTDTGQWKTSVQVVLKDARNTETPFEYLGRLPIPQDALYNNNQPHNNGGPPNNNNGGGSFSNGGGQGNFQSNGGFNNGGFNNGGGFNSGGGFNNGGGQGNNGGSGQGGFFSNTPGGNAAPTGPITNYGGPGGTFPPPPQSPHPTLPTHHRHPKMMSRQLMTTFRSRCVNM